MGPNFAILSENRKLYRNILNGRQRTMAHVTKNAQWIACFGKIKHS